MRVPRLVSLSLVMLLPMLVLPMVTAAQGNSEAAHACQQGGYLNYTDEDGNGFKNAGQCTRYAAQGGELAPIPPRTVSLTFFPRDFRDNCGMTIAVTGFAPGTYRVFLTWEDRTGNPTFGPLLRVESNGTGSVTTGVTGGFVADQGELMTATVDGVSDTERTAC